MLLRFICVFCPINMYMRHLRGDSCTLPYVNQLSLMLLGPDEFLVTDSEDMQSCFNIFEIPPAWNGYFAFAMRVAASAFGDDPNQTTLVCMRSVPMGWVGAVDVMQNMARNFLFLLSEVPQSKELDKAQPIPEGDTAVVCMDGFDFVQRIPLKGPAVAAPLCPTAEFVSTRGEGSPEHGAPRFPLVEDDPTWLDRIAKAQAKLRASSENQRFVHTCNVLGVPLNPGERLVAGLLAPILGAELCGMSAQLRLSRNKVHKLIGKGLALLTKDAWAAPALQHWAGLFCFGASLRRLAFACLQNIFHWVCFDASDVHPSLMPFSVLVLMGAALSPLLYGNLRAPLRPVLSCTDTSESGGGASEASSLFPMSSPSVAHHAWTGAASANEEAASLGFPCGMCSSPDAHLGTFAPCPGACGAFFCNIPCLLAHCAKRPCALVVPDAPVFADGFSGPRYPLTWAVAQHHFTVLQPFDKAASGGSDFFSPEGAHQLEQLDNNYVAFEHWGPDCSTMSRARGRPI